MHPNDPLYAQQWHFTKLGNIEKIWDEYSGAGIHVGVYDSGIDLTHVDLAANYDPSRRVIIDGTPLDGLPNATTPDAHGTAVAGLISAAANNGEGGVGVAWGSTITSIDHLDPSSPVLQNYPNYYSSFHQSVNFDVTNHSWNLIVSSEAYSSAVNLHGGGDYAGVNVEYDYASANGRGELGTVIVQAVGNLSIDAQSSGLNASRFTISVAGVGPDGYAADYSNYGACVLVTAPTKSSLSGPDESGLVTTDISGPGGFYNNDYAWFDGTSGSAPIVSGVVALMLEANPNLGWRDVQNILAASAKHTGSTIGAAAPGTNENSKWFVNDAATWNGGGMHFSNDYGYGTVNAYNAVRMAEVWSLFGSAQTSGNERLWFNADENDYTIADQSTLQRSILLTPSPGIVIEHVELTLDLTHDDYQDLRIFLVSPQGTEVQLYDGSGGSDTTTDSLLRWTYGADALRGENPDGNWTVRIEDVDAGNTGTLSRFGLEVFGSTHSVNDVYHYTDEFLAMKALAGEAGRATVADTNGGTDWIDAAAVTGSFALNLTAGQASKVNNVTWFTIAAGTLIENAVTGDGNDTIIANLAPNALRGMRGNDTLDGGDGNDTLFGGAGNDSLKGGLGADTLQGEAGNDTYILENGTDNVIDTAGIDTVTSTINRSLATSTYLEVENLVLLGTATIGAGNALANTITGNALNNVFDGGTGNDTLIGGAGNDSLKGGLGVDTLRGEAGNDTYILENAADNVIDTVGIDTVISTINRSLAAAAYLEVENLMLLGTATIGTGNTLANTITGNTLNNVLDGGTGNDTLFGAAGNDFLKGGLGVDTLRGDAGNDTYILENGTDNIVDTAGIDTVTSTINRSLAAAAYLEVENLTLLPGALTGTGNTLANTITGNAANNTLDGGTGNDILIGNGGNDILIGNAGKDTMTGGAGNDVFRFLSAAHSVVGANADIVTDFGDGGLDKIDVSALSGPAMTYRHNLAFTAAGQVRINDVAGADVIVEVNTGGTLVADVSVRLTATTLASMSAADFVL